MFRSRWSVLIPVIAALPLVIAAAQDAPAKEPLAEEVYKNITVFKGVPAKDLIPAMKFMSVSLNQDCKFCHDETDYSKDTRGKGAARHMVEMQRDINTKYFNGRLQVTCNSCHNGKEQPTAAPFPEGIRMRHVRFQTELQPADFFKKHVTAVGTDPASITLTGTAQKGKEEKVPYTLVQASGGRYAITNGDKHMGNDGSTVWYHEGNATFKLDGEGKASVNRFGNSWRAASMFEGYDRVTVTGKETIGKASTIVVRGFNTPQNSSDELYFDEATGLLLRLVNMTRCTIGTIVTTVDYEDYRNVKGVKVPFRTVFTTGASDKTIVEYTSAVISAKADDKLFAMPSGTHQ